MREIHGFLRLANPFGHPYRKSARKFWFCKLASRLASLFGQGFTHAILFWLVIFFGLVLSLKPLILS